MRTSEGLAVGLAAATTAVAFLVMLALETLRPLRRMRESKLRRMARNFTTAGISLACLTALQTPVLIPVARWAAQHRIGLLNLVALPRAATLVLGVLLLDYTLWVWHLLNHKVPFLWRFHLVHHVDRDMDASTGIRFHFGEQILSIGYRLVQVAVIGASPGAIGVWHLLLVPAILFHHSNTDLPLWLERILVRIIVTPRMHGIHHSNWRNETNTNWSSLLSAWDYLHGTVELSVPQKSVEIGVAAFAVEQDVTLPKLLVMPFTRQREDWVGPDGPRLERPHDPAARATLAL